MEDEPLRKTMCETCPFREGSKYAFLAEDLAKSAMTTSRICHSTGSNNAIHRRTGKKRHICRGARNLQLHAMACLNVIEEATDEAWNDARRRYGMKPTIIKDTD